jgi:hypothetical protein
VFFPNDRYHTKIDDDHFRGWQSVAKVISKDGSNNVAMVVEELMRQKFRENVSERLKKYINNKSSLLFNKKAADFSRSPIDRRFEDLKVKARGLIDDLEESRNFILKIASEGRK